jgi:hypothetical protein
MAPFKSAVIGASQLLTGAPHLVFKNGHCISFLCDGLDRLRTLYPEAVAFIKRYIAHYLKQAKDNLNFSYMRAVS